MPNATPKASSKRKPVTTLQTWNHGKVIPGGLNALMRVVKYGQDMGRKNKAGKEVLSKSLTITLPSIKDTGKSGNAARQVQLQAGMAAKPILEARRAAFAANSAVVISRYQETPKDSGDELALRYKKLKVQDEIQALATKYHMTPQQVIKKLGIKPEVLIEV